MKDVLTAIGTVIIQLMLAIVAFLYLYGMAVAAEYEIRDRHGSRSDYTIRTDDDEHYTIHNWYGGEVRSFDMPQQRQDPYEVRSRTPTPGDPRTLVLPPLGGWKQ